ncbi:F-box protein: endocytic membrane traffic, recycling ReCYcling 1 [Pichia californica]|uniref:F-box protein: endocytic membrane traffic, recycling ReCYcling 1 n=1 Tax=Pichia californica TaxID=460514 RepID=A0A9P7BE98_9ASCO|nr:F-box protein: endocytic membrane traffic, recycling ReCYcling 1 [[Candida] californica]
MKRTLVLPNPEKEGSIPFEIIDTIVKYTVNFNDLINLSLINKEIYNHIMNNDELWVNYLKRINMWQDSNCEIIENIDELNLNPINCFDIKINNSKFARSIFIKIYSILSPIIKQLLIDNYSNFQNLSIFNTFSTPITQSKLFKNIGNFLNIFKNFENFNNLIIRFNSILNLFINSIISEINFQLKNKNYSIVLNLIKSLDCLSDDDNNLNINPIDSLLEFFIVKYNEDYNYLSSNDLVNECFIHESIDSKKRGIVKGYSFNFKKIDEIFNNIENLLNNQINEIKNIFNSNTFLSNINEIPIILKILENFLSNYLIGILIDKIITKARQIDSLDEVNKNVEFNEDEDNDLDPYINIMNEESLFFQCFPYLHSSLISTLQKLDYPQTQIFDNNKMDYIKVVCEFVNYYYEQYLIEFSNELPRQCHISLIQLIKSWQSNNEKIQKNIEFEILKLVDEDENDSKKFNFEIFNTFSNLFSFKSKEKEKEKENEIEDQQEIKLTKMAAKLKILITKVESLKTLVSIDLTVLLLQHIKNSYDLLLGLTKYSTTDQLNKEIYTTCINIFNDMLNILINNHIKPGFQEALNRLRKYKPLNISNDENKDNFKILEPVNNFIELVDVGDLILQMINVFYNHELIDNGIIKIKIQQQSKDFLRMNNIEKSIKILESTLDNYVATGLDISINIIIDEIKFKVEDCVGKIPINLNSRSKLESIPQLSSSTEIPISNRPTSSSSTTTNTTTIDNLNSMVYNYTNIESLPLNNGNMSKWCEIFINVLDNHFKLLQDSIDKSIMDVFKQELGDRLIIFLIQLILLKFKISNFGGIQFSFDINLLYSYYFKNKIKPAIEYLIGFKKIDQLYLINCSNLNSKEFKFQCKELGKLIINIGRENGIFTPEEVYQFVSRRSDWDKIKKNIDKVVYGFGADDCIIV